MNQRIAKKVNLWVEGANITGFDQRIAEKVKTYCRDEDVLNPFGFRDMWVLVQPLHMDFWSEGYKLHLSLERDQLESQEVEELLDYLIQKEIMFKYVRKSAYNVFAFSNYERLNEDDTQKGKHLVLYPSLDCVWELVSELLELFPFLREQPSIFVPQDKHVVGRIFTRYAGFMNDEIIDPSIEPEINVFEWDDEVETTVLYTRMAWGRDKPYRPEWVLEPPCFG